MAKANQSRIDRFARFAEGIVPDAITSSIIFLVILFICALAMGNTVQKTMEAYYKGLWMLLAFTMQMDPGYNSGLGIRLHPPFQAHYHFNCSHGTVRPSAISFSASSIAFNSSSDNGS